MRYYFLKNIQYFWSYNMTYRLMCWNMLTGLGGKRNMDTECSKIITKIKENYASLEKGIVNQLYFEAEHGATIGHYREKI